MADCSVTDCDRPAARKQGGYCWAHAKRITRGGELTAPVRAPDRSPFEVLTDAALAYANAEADADYEKAKDRLRKAAQRLRDEEVARLRQRLQAAERRAYWRARAGKQSGR